MSAPGSIRKAWLRWKTLRLPWRKKFLVGLDLEGNTFWEFKDQLSSKQGRMRRIVQYSNALHYSEVSGKITPAWHQWLRHTRQEPPSLTEQSHDLIRQKNLKLLAAQADAKWAAKPSYFDAPGQRYGQPLPAIGVRDPGGYSTDTTDNKSQYTRTRDSPVTESEGLLPENKISSFSNAQVSDHQRPHADQESSRRHDEERAAATMAKSKKQDNPWKNARGGPSEEWQPKSWSPGTSTSRS